MVKVEDGRAEAETVSLSRSDSLTNAVSAKWLEDGGEAIITVSVSISISLIECWSDDASIVLGVVGLAVGKVEPVSIASIEDEPSDEDAAVGTDRPAAIDVDSLAPDTEVDVVVAVVVVIVSDPTTPDVFKGMSITSPSTRKRHHLLRPPPFTPTSTKHSSLITPNDLSHQPILRHSPHPSQPPSYQSSSVFILKLQ